MSEKDITRKGRHRRPQEVSRSPELKDRLKDYSQAAQAVLAGSKENPSRPLAHRLISGSLTAGAATVGLALTGGAPAEAKIIHGTPNKAFGTLFGAYALTMEGSNAEVSFKGWSTTPASPYSSIWAWRAGDNFSLNGQIIHWGGSNTTYYVNALPSGAPVGPATNPPNIPGGYFYWYYSSDSYGGAWTYWNRQNFFGFRFNLEGGGPVYGWAEVYQVNPTNGILMRWAYEDTGAPIAVGAVPEANALALFALGAAGVVAYRRRKKKED